MHPQSSYKIRVTVPSLVFMVRGQPCVRNLLDRAIYIGPAFTQDRLVQDLIRCSTTCGKMAECTTALSL